MTPYDLYEKIFYKWLVLTYIIGGVNFFNDNFYQKCIRTTYIGMIILYVSCTGYTIFNYTFEVQVQCLSVIGFSFQGILKYYAFITYWSDIEYCIEFMNNVYRINHNQISLNQNVLLKATKIILIIYKLLTVLYTSVMIGMVFIPIGIHLWTGELINILPAEIPGIDETSLFGFRVTAFYHTTMIMIALMGTFVSDLSIVGFLMNVWTLSQIFCNGFKELNDCIINNSTIVHRKFLVRNLLQRHQEIRIYMRSVRQIMFYIVIAEVSTASMQIIFLVFLIIIINWIPAYFLFLGLCFQLLCFCLAGTFAELTNDNIYETIVNSKWYLLSISEQKSIAFMLSMAQRESILDVGGIYPLNVNLFLMIMKSIYSYTMMLLQFVD